MDYGQPIDASGSERWRRPRLSPNVVRRGSWHTASALPCAVVERSPPPHGPFARGRLALVRQPVRRSLCKVLCVPCAAQRHAAACASSCGDDQPPTVRATDWQPVRVHGRTLAASRPSSKRHCCSCCLSSAPERAGQGVVAQRPSLRGSARVLPRRAVASAPDLP
jgi:hypothetical protein